MMEHFNASSSQNFTDFHADWKISSWTICQTITIIVLILVLWIFISMILYGRETNKFKLLKSSQSTEFDGGVVYLFGFLTITAGLVRLAFTQAFLVIQINHNSTNSACQRSLHGLAISYALMSLIFYMFLWLRQRAFYTNPQFKSAKSPLVVFLEYAVLVVAVVSGVVIIVLLVAMRTYGYNKIHGCERHSTNLVNRLRVWGIRYYGPLFVYIFEMGTMLILFIYPLLKQYRKIAGMSTAISLSNLSSATSSAETTQKGLCSRIWSVIRHENILVRSVMRSIYSTVLAIAGEIVAAVITLKFSSFDHYDLTLPLAIFNINVLLYGYVVLLSYTTWRLILLSPIRAIRRTAINHEQSGGFGASGRMWL